MHKKLVCSLRPGGEGGGAKCLNGYVCQECNFFLYTAPLTSLLSIGIFFIHFFIGILPSCVTDVKMSSC